MIQLENNTINRGEKKQMYVEVTGGGMKLPVTVLCGETEGETVLISAGVHGAEYVGIQTVMELSQDIMPGAVKGNIIFLLQANPEASHTYTRFYVPQDGENLNRMFPGKADGTMSQRIAYTMENSLQNLADYYIDVHAGDTSEMAMPFVYYTGVASENVCKISQEMAQATNMEIRAKSSSQNGAYSNACMKGIPSVLLERGGGGRYTQKEVASYKQDILNILMYLGLLKGEEVHTCTQKNIETATYIDSPSHGFWYPQYQAGESFLKGSLLGQIKNVWGEVILEYYAEYNGIVLYETVSPGVGEGEPLIAYGFCQD